jgi:hypothetical protein
MLSFGFGVDNQHIYMDEPPFSSSRWKYHGTIGVLYALVMYYVGYFKVRNTEDGHDTLDESKINNLEFLD